MTNKLTKNLLGVICLNLETKKNYQKELPIIFRYKNIELNVTLLKNNHLSTTWC